MTRPGIIAIPATGAGKAARSFHIARHLDRPCAALGPLASGPSALRQDP